MEGIAKYQRIIDKWIKTYGVRYFNELTNTTILMEEVGELARLMSRVYGEQSFKKETSASEAKAKIADEMADIFFVLCCLANQTEVNLDEAIERNLQKKTSRDKNRHTKNTKLKA